MLDYLISLLIKNKYFLHDYHSNFQGLNKYYRSLLFITMPMSEKGWIAIQTQFIINLTQCSSSNINRLLSFDFKFKRPSITIWFPIYFLYIIRYLTCTSNTHSLYLYPCDLSHTEYSFSSTKFAQFKKGVNHGIEYRSRDHFTQNVHKIIFNNYLTKHTEITIFILYISVY